MPSEYVKKFIESDEFETALIDLINLQITNIDHNVMIRPGLIRPYKMLCLLRDKGELTINEIVEYLPPNTTKATKPNTLATRYYMENLRAKGFVEREQQTDDERKKDSKKDYKNGRSGPPSYKYSLCKKYLEILNNTRRKALQTKQLTTA